MGISLSSDVGETNSSASGRRAFPRGRLRTIRGFVALLGIAGLGEGESGNLSGLSARSLSESEPKRLKSCREVEVDRKLKNLTVPPELSTASST